MNNADLFRGLQAGYGTPQYEAAAKYIIAHFGPKVKGYVMKNSGKEEDGDDIFQIVFMIMLENIENGTYDATDNFGGLFMRITRNRWLDKLAHDAHIQQGYMDDFTPDEEGEMRKDIPSNERNEDKSVNGIPLNKLLAILEKWDEPRGKRLLRWFYIDGVNSRELAEEEGISDNTMRQQLRRYRREFRAFVADNIK
jgi:RNA polymerase sigma factor (sigma-70 family)